MILFRANKLHEHLHVSQAMFMYQFLFLLLFISCITSSPPCFAGGVEKINTIPEKELIPLEKVNVITLDSREKAESFARDLEKSGYKTVVTAGEKGDSQNYKVFILIDKKEQNPSDASGGLSQGPADNITTQDKTRSYESDEKPSWGMLEKRHRYVHASLSLSGIYTDNALSSTNNKQSDFSTFLSPAIWIEFPYSSQHLAPLSLSSRSPGGSLLTRQWPDSLLRYQASLYYTTNIPLTSSSGGLAFGKIPSQTLTGRLLLSGNRFSLLAEDQYEFAHQEQEAGDVATTGKNDRYNSNLFNILLSYESRNRLVFQVGYSHFITGYHSDLGSFRDRQDNGFSASVSYKLSPKIDLTAEYRYLDISYDNAGGLDSSEHYVMGGLSWKITAKSRGLLKVGYGVKNFDHLSDRFNYFSFEAQLDHRFTPKTALSLSAFRKTRETNVMGMAFALTTGVNVRLQHLLTSRLTSSAGFIVANDHYKTWPQLTSGVKSRIYQVNLALQYEFRKWLRGGIGYAYTIKNSSDSTLEYKSNTFYFNITAEI